MPQFRKKPVVIEAIQHTLMEDDGSGPFPVFATDPAGWLTEAMELLEHEEGAVFWDNEGLKIRTLEGTHLATPGDFIIRGVKGELYPCKPDIFAATYEAA
jgi:hypothetical protein